VGHGPSKSGVVGMAGISSGYNDGRMEHPGSPEKALLCSSGCGHANGWQWLMDQLGG
jgi:hypothetical protein